MKEEKNVQMQDVVKKSENKAKKKTKKEREKEHNDDDDTPRTVSRPCVS